MILTALQKYGVIVADNGSAMFISGTPDDNWNNDELDQLKTLTTSDFEVVVTGPVYTPANVPAGPSPTVSSFAANPATITAGQTSTLSWSAANAIYTIVSPEVGPCARNDRGGSADSHHDLQALCYQPVWPQDPVSDRDSALTRARARVLLLLRHPLCGWASRSFFCAAVLVFTPNPRRERRRSGRGRDQARDRSSWWWRSP